MLLLAIGSVYTDKKTFEHQLRFSKWKTSLNILSNSRWEHATPWVSFTRRYTLYLIPRSSTKQRNILFWILLYPKHSFILILLLSASSLIPGWAYAETMRIGSFIHFQCYCNMKCFINSFITFGCSLVNTAFPHTSFHNVWFNSSCLK